MIVYRITAKEYAGLLTASGKANRWNDPGAFVIYTASSASLSCLEHLVHLQTLDFKKKFSITLFEIPATALIETVDKSTLPKDWVENNNDEAECRLIGRKWYREKENLLLSVPSSVMPIERNFIINTIHPDFDKIKVFDIIAFSFDKRLLKI